MKTRLLELAEEPGIWTPPGPDAEVVAGQGYQVVVRRGSGTVERIRLGDDEVPRALEETRRLARERGLGRMVWWTGELSTPAGLADRLTALGLTADPDEPALTTVAIIAEPAGGAAEVEVRRVTDRDGFLRALEIDWEAWGLDPEARRRRRARAPAEWEALAGDPRIEHYLALLDGEPVGFARAVFAAWAGILMGGSTLPSARGRGVYTALVHARWHDAVARDAPRLTSAVGPASAPILERLGFERIGGVRLIRDGHVGRATGR